MQQLHVKLARTAAPLHFCFRSKKTTTCLKGRRYITLQICRHKAVVLQHHYLLCPRLHPNKEISIEYSCKCLDMPASW